MNVKTNAGWLYGALIVVAALWTLHGFLEALLAGGVTAIATWPLYTRFAARLGRRMSRSGIALAFTSLVTLFVLAPILFAFGALANEAHALLLEIAAADRKGIAAPVWLQGVPLAGSWLAERWEAELAQPGALSVWVRRDASSLFVWGQSLGYFMARQLYIIAFANLVVFFLYLEGESLARQFRQVLRSRIGEPADGYIDLAARAVRASLNSMLLVGLFVGLATWPAYAIAGAPHAGLWAAITGALSLVPFVGYGASAALSLQLGVQAGTGPALLAFGLGCSIQFIGDKVVRPAVARNGTHLPFVWVLMGCLGGFEALGLVGLVIGPVFLALARELWEQRVRALRRAETVS